MIVSFDHRLNLLKRATARRTPGDARVAPAGRCASVEMLEQRQLFTSAFISFGVLPWNRPPVASPIAADANDQTTEAQSLGDVALDRTVSGTLASSADVNLYSFTVSAGQRVNFNVDDATGGPDTYLRIFDASGSPLAANDDALAPNETAASNAPFLQYTFATGGTYYAGISAKGNIAYSAANGTGDAGGTGGTGAYTLTLALTGGSGSQGLAATAVMNGETTPITFKKYNSSTTAIDPTVRTWVLVHGRNGTYLTSGMQSLAALIKAQYPNDQVIGLDWSQAAAAPTYYDSEQWLQPVGTAAAAALTAHGFQGQTLNFIGYSFGTYISEETAERVVGGSANTILTIDPPMDAPGGYDPHADINFAAHSSYSWSFHDTDPTHTGDAITPTTADESIAVTGTTHSNIIAAVIKLLDGSTSLSSRFSLSRLLSDTPGPWRPNRYSDQGAAASGGLYEAVLGTSSSGTFPASLTYISDATGLSVTE